MLYFLAVVLLSFWDIYNNVLICLASTTDWLEYLIIISYILHLQKSQERSWRDLWGQSHAHAHFLSHYFELLSHYYDFLSHFYDLPWGYFYFQDSPLFFFNWRTWASIQISYFISFNTLGNSPFMIMNKGIIWRKLLMREN